MLINPYSYINYDDVKYVSDESFIKSGITDRKRRIFVIKKYDDININSNIQYNDVILINYSLSKKDEESNICLKNVYLFSNNSFSKNNIIHEFKGSTVDLSYAMSTGYISNTKYFGDDIYKDLGMVLGHDYFTLTPTHINLDDLYGDMIDISDKLDIVDPRYYTKEQYEYDTGNDVLNMLNEPHRYNISDLIDEKTEIYYVDNKNGFENKLTYNDKTGLILMKDDYFDTIERSTLINSIPLNLFQYNVESLLSSYKFIFDSKMGINFIDIKSPRMVMKSKTKDYITKIKKQLLKSCNKIVKSYGDIRLMYYYSDIEDRVSVIFEDGRVMTNSLVKRDLYERAVVSIVPEDLEERIDEYISNKKVINY